MLSHSCDTVKAAVTGGTHIRGVQAMRPKNPETNIITKMGCVTPSDRSSAALVQELCVFCEASQRLTIAFHWTATGRCAMRRALHLQITQLVAENKKVSFFLRTTTSARVAVIAVTEATAQDQFSGNCR